MNISEYEASSLSKLTESIHAGKWSNEGLVQLIERAGMYLNLETIPNYAKKNGMSYNGVKKHRYIRSVLGVKMVIDND
jgi:hypothetical protein